LSSDTDSSNLTLFKKLINIGYNRVCKKLCIYYTEESTTFTTVDDDITGTSDQSYRLPVGFNTLTDLYVTVGSNQYRATLIQDPELWRQINSTTSSSTSDFLQYCYIRRDRVELWPIPSSAQTATMWYTKFRPELSAADYAGGTITTLASAGTTVTGDTTVWTGAMVGRYFKINADDEWYRIASRASDTSITLEQGYEGTAIAAGTEAYTIGEMPITPDDTHELPVWYALWKYGLGFRKDRSWGKDFERDWKLGLQEALQDWNNRSTSQVANDREIYGIGRGRVINPNYYPEELS